MAELVVPPTPAMTFWCLL